MTPLLLAAVGAAALVLWLTQTPPERIDPRRPGLDRTPDQAATAEPAVLEGVLETFDGKPSKLPGDWPRFRGANYDNIAATEVSLARTWPDDGPKKLWSLDVGEGYAAPAIKNGRVYLLDYDANRQADSLRCLSLDDGRDIWRYSYPIKIKRNHGMSRTVPAVTDKFVVTIGPKGQALCVDAETGEKKWMLDLAAQFGATVPPWYAGQCPLIDDGRVILAIGSDETLLMAVDIDTGEVAWSTPNAPGWRMSHASIMPMTLAGRQTYVYVAHGGVVGIAADTGELLWRTNAWKIRIATVPSPVFVDGSRIFLSGGYNSGCMMLKVSEAGGKYSAEVLWQLKAKQFGATQQTPILYDGYLYGVRPDGELTCLGLDGKIAWTSGSTHRFGLGPLMIANGLIYVMDDDGELTLAKASPAGYKQLAQAKILDGHESWGPMALAGDRLIVRDLTRMVCLDVGE